MIEYLQVVLILVVALVVPQSWAKDSASVDLFSSKYNLVINASESKEGHLVEAFHKVYNINKRGVSSRQVVSCYSYEKESCQLQLPDGKYLIKTFYKDYQQNTPVEINAGQPVESHVVLEKTGSVQIATAESEKGPWVEAYHSVFRKTDNKVNNFPITGCYSFTTEPCRIQLPAGNYRLASTYQSFSQLTDFTIQHGSLNQLLIVMGHTGKVAISAENKGYEGVLVEAYHSIYKSDDSTHHRIAGCYSYEKEACVLELPVGKYYIKSSFNDMEKETPLNITGGEMKQVISFKGN